MGHSSCTVTTPSGEGHTLRLLEGFTPLRLLEGFTPLRVREGFTPLRVRERVTPLCRLQVVTQNVSWKGLHLCPVPPVVVHTPASSVGFTPPRSTRAAA